MRLGVSIAQVGRLADPAALRSAAAGAEQAGYWSLWVLDQLVDRPSVRRPPPRTDGAPPDGVPPDGVPPGGALPEGRGLLRTQAAARQARDGTGLAAGGARNRGDPCSPDGHRHGNLPWTGSHCDAAGQSGPSLRRAPRARNPSGRGNFVTAVPTPAQRPADRAVVVVAGAHRPRRRSRPAPAGARRSAIRAPAPRSCTPPARAATSTPRSSPRRRWSRSGPPTRR